MLLHSYFAVRQMSLCGGVLANIYNTNAVESTYKPLTNTYNGTFICLDKYMVCTTSDNKLTIILKIVLFYSQGIRVFLIHIH